MWSNTSVAAAMPSHIGREALAPPSRSTASGSRARTARASATEARFCWKTEEKPTTPGRRAAIASAASATRAGTSASASRKSSALTASGCSSKSSASSATGRPKAASLNSISPCIRVQDRAKRR